MPNLAKSTPLECSEQHLREVVDELKINGVGLQGTSTEGQLAMLRKALLFRGAKGLNTYEGKRAGYAGMAMRIVDLKRSGCVIASVRESVIGPDGLFHKGMSRYIMVRAIEIDLDSKRECVSEFA